MMKTTMKKMIVSLAATAMAVTSCVSVFAEGEDLTGSWYLNFVEEEGMQLDAGGLGTEMEIVLNEDGSAMLYSAVPGEEATEEKGKWSATDDGLIVVDSAGTEMPLTLDEDGYLAFDEDGTILFFGREKVEIEIFEPGAVVEDSTMKDFIGTWEATHFWSDGSSFSYALLGMPSTLEITEEGAVLTEVLGEDMEFTTEYTCSFENGVLTLTDEEYDETKTLVLYDSGAIADGDIAEMTGAEDEDMITFYQLPAEDEAETEEAAE